MNTGTEATGMIKLGEATRLLAEVRTIDDAKELADKARAAEVWAARAKKGLLAQNYAAEVRIRAERMAGQFLAELERGHGPGRGKRNTKDINLSELKRVMSSVAISANQVSQWQRLAKIEAKDLDARIQTFNDKADRLTTSGIIATTAATGHDGDAWMSPEDIAGRGQRVLGGIDSDPASSAEANNVIKAKRFYTKEQNGLAKPWTGKVWLNPPFSHPLVSQFVARLVERYEAGAVTRAILLVNAATDVAWFQDLLGRYPVCLTRGRVAFVLPGGKKTKGNMYGQAAFFLGCEWEAVKREFSDLGVIVEAAE